jgi:hypothetical protein
LCANVASVSGLSIFGCPLGFLSRLFSNIIYFLNDYVLTVPKIEHANQYELLPDNEFKKYIIFENKRERKPKGQPKIDNPETLATLAHKRQTTQNKNKQKSKTKTNKEKKITKTKHKNSQHNTEN